MTQVPSYFPNGARRPRKTAKTVRVSIYRRQLLNRQAVRTIRALKVPIAVRIVGDRLMPEVTYGRLDAVLRSLGFSASVFEKDTRVYKHPSTGALVTFPIYPDSKPVLPHHLVATRMTLDGFGIVSPPGIRGTTSGGLRR